VFPKGYSCQFQSTGTSDLLDYIFLAAILPLEAEGCFSAMLLAISIVALSQFALYYWRAVLAGVAALPVSDRVLVAAQVENGQLTPEDFQTLAGLHDLTPDLYPNRSGLGLVRATTVLSKVLTPFSARFPPSLSGSERERVICARYAAVQVDRRLQANLDLAASLRSC